MISSGHVMVVAHINLYQLPPQAYTSYLPVKNLSIEMKGVPESLSLTEMLLAVESYSMSKSHFSLRVWQLVEIYLYNRQRPLQETTTN